MEITEETREVGPFNIVINGRTVATRPTRSAAERAAQGRLGAVVQGRKVLVARFASA